MESPRGTSRVSAGMRVENRLLVHKITLTLNPLSDNPEVKAKGGGGAKGTYPIIFIK